MKIIKIGKILKPKICKCFNCKSKLEYESKDCIQGRFGIKVIMCPVCEVYNDV